MLCWQQRQILDMNSLLAALLALVLNSHYMTSATSHSFVCMFSMIGMYGNAHVHGQHITLSLGC